MKLLTQRETFQQQATLNLECRYYLIPLLVEGLLPIVKKQIEENAKKLNIPIKFFETDIFDVTTVAGGNPCYLCARMRRGHLYAKAKELGCNKIALGHHKNDVIETTLMGMLFSGQIQGMLPKLKSTNFEGMELIRPLYYVSENAIKN